MPNNSPLVLAVAKFDIGEKERRDKKRRRKQITSQHQPWLTAGSKKIDKT
jgi:hypothetical protein